MNIECYFDETFFFALNKLLIVKHFKYNNISKDTEFP